MNSDDVQRRLAFALIVTGTLVQFGLGFRHTDSPFYYISAIVAAFVLGGACHAEFVYIPGMQGLADAARRTIDKLYERLDRQTEATNEDRNN